MPYLNSKALKGEASLRLERTGSNARNLVLCYTGLIVVVNLLVNGLNLILEQQIAGTGGLSGLGLRSALQTVQTVLSYVSMLFTPFWTAGFLYSMIRLSRSGAAQPKDLLMGLRRLPRLLSYFLYQILILFVVSTLATYAASYLFALSPFAQTLSDAILPLAESGELLTAEGAVNIEAIPTEVLTQSALPLMGMFLTVFLPVYLIISYSLRLTDYLLMEGKEVGALGAMVVSAKLMKGHRLQMLKLDLSFWWFYVLEALCVVACYLDMILPLLGIALPFNETVAYFVFLALYGVLELALHLWKKPYLDTTYVLAYEALVHPPQTEEIVI